MRKSLARERIREESKEKDGHKISRLDHQMAFMERRQEDDYCDESVFPLNLGNMNFCDQ